MLRSTPTAPAAARRLVRQLACRAHGAHLMSATELVVTELVTNAVRHGAPPITVDMDCIYGKGLVLRVSDTSPATPTIRYAAPNAEGGRGMLLVAILSTSWGVTATHGGGKTVWATLDPELAIPV